MKRKVLVLAFVIAFFGFGLINPTTNFESISMQLQDQPTQLEFTPSAIGDNTEDYVDQLSDLHPLSDIGTHNVFADLQADDTNYDALTEADQGTAGNNVQDTVDSDATDIDSSSDVGTQGTFANAQDLADADYMTLQEADQGTADMTAEYSPTSYTNILADVTNPTYAYDGSLTTFAYQDIGVDRYPAYELLTWETGTGTITNVDLVVRFSIGTLINDQYGMFWKVSTSADQTLWAMSGTSRALNNYTFTSLTEPNDGTWSWTDIQNFVLFWNTEKVTNSDGVNLNYYEAVLKVNVTGTTDYELDFEYQWTGADFDETNEEVCINVQTASQGGENLKAWEWTGSDWATLGTCSFDGWNNFTASYLTSATYYIKLNDSLQSDETTPSTWDIDSMILHIWTDPVVDYELDLEVGWIAADFDETNEELCIFPVTGGSWPTEDIKVDVWNGAWTNVIADLTPDQWNNVSIGSYLSDATFEIRFLGGTETGDSTQDTWEIDAVLIHTWTPSYTPVIDQIPTLDNPSDTNYMYAQYLEYQVTAYVSDQNGFDDITYLEVGIWDNTRSTEYFRFRYDEDTTSFTEEYDGGTYVTLNTGSSTATESGNDIDATFYFTVDWDFPDVLDLDANCTVVDAQSESSETWYEVGWNVETRLEYSVTPSIDDGSGTAYRGNLDGSFSLTGTVIYLNSVDDYPSSTAVDVWVSASEYGTDIGPWNDTTLTSGAFDVTCYADDAVGQDTYTVKVVEEGAGSGGTDLYYTTSATDTYIADQLVISITDPSDQRINIGDNATGIVVSAIYDYDDSVFDGSLILNDTTFDYGTVGRRGYTVTSVSGGAHGVSLIGVNDATYCIWDSVTITITGPSVQRQNLNANATGIVVTGIYDYDGTAFDGIFTLNNTDFDGDGTVARWGYTVSSISGGTHGIIWISTNDVTYHIWDSVTITIVGPTNNRQDIGANASGIFVSGVYDYDGIEFDGSFTMNNTDYNGDGTVGRWGYTVDSISGGVYGITTIGTNDETFMIWDSITINIIGPTDNRQNLNANASGIVVLAVYDYDGTAFDGTFTLNNTDFDGDGTAVRWGYTVTSVSGDSYGITAISSNDETYMIWDSVTITITNPLDQRQNLNANATGIIVSGIYDYDGTAFDGTITLNNTDFDGDGTAVRWGYTAASLSGDTYDITVININDETFMIWDSITITITGPTDNRQNLNANASGIVISAVYDYDGTAFDGAFTLNNTDFDGDGTAVRWGYTVTSVSGDSYGITTISTNDETFMIWDSVTITIIGPTDNRQDLNANASGIIISAVYDYDGTAFDGAFTLNNTDFDGDGTAVKWGYTVTSVSGDSYGITTISTNDETFMIWDSLTITITGPTDNRQNLNANASGIIISAVYDYDGTAFDGAFTLNNTDFDGDGTAVRWGYTVTSVSGDSYGITTISTNDETFMIWDSVTITIIGPTDNRQDLNANASGIIISAVYDYDGTAFDGAFTLNNTDFDGDGTAVRWGYTVTSVSGDSYGITTISANDETYMIWDSITITIIGPTDSRININANASGIVISAVYDYDGTIFDGTFTLNDTTYDHGVVGIYGYTVSSVSGDTHGITSIGTNDVTWCIFDSITISMSNPTDQRDNLNANATGIVVTAVYDYDGVIFDGSFTLNNTDFDGDGTVTRWGYTVTSVSGDTHGITFISSNDETYMIWDSITITMTDPLDQRDNLNANATGIVVSAIYDYDSSVFDGTFTLNNTDFDGDGTAVRWGYTVASVSGDAYGITTISTNDATFMIWDSLTITITDPLDQRDNIGDNATGIFVSAIYDYDGLAFDGILTLNNTQFSYATVQIQGYTVDSVSGGTHGITAISLNDETWCIWDQVVVRGYSVLDDRVNVGDFVDINVTVEFEYDDTPVTTGSIIVNGEWASHLGSGVWQITVNQSTVSQNVFHSVISSGNSHGIIAIDDSPSQSVIWDRIQIRTTTTDDGRIDYGSQATIAVTARLEWDFHYLGSGDSLYLNDSLMTWNGTHFILNPQFFQVGKWTFFVNSTGANETTYGISAVFLDNNQVDQIWDRIQILTTLATDGRVDYGTGTTTINVTAQLEYDVHPLTTGDTLYLNGVLMTWDTDHFYVVVGPYFVVDSFNFYVNTSGASETTYGITAINVDGNNADVIWDRLLITISVDDATPDNGIQANFTLSVIFDFDDTPCTTYQIVILRNTTWWHSFTDGNKSQFVDTNSDLTYTYTVQLVTSESAYNVLVFSANSQQVVWSSIPNSAPTNDANPVLVNPDDGYMYARYKFYIITSNVSDADGYNDIQYVELTLYDNTTTTPLWTVRYTVSGDTFSIQIGSAYIDLSVSSFATMVGNDLDITWIIKIEWDHTDMVNMVPHQFVIDSIVSDSDFSVTTWDVETRLDYSSTPSLSDDRGDVGTSDLTATGGVTYFGSARAPLANETDVWVIHDISGTWSGDLAAGSFSIANIGSSASVRLNTYTIKIVAEGDGSGGIDLYYTSSETDTFITDRIEVYQAGVVDGRININVDCEVWWRARYEYDSIEIQSGLTLDLNGSRTLVWDSGDLYWRWQETSASPAFAGFDVVSGSESAYGLTATSVSTAAQRVIWDAVLISMTDPTDQRINTGENASGIVVSAVYAYDGADFDGTVTLNNTNFVYGVAQKQGYMVLSVSGDTYGITTVSSNDETWCIWDSLTITITDPADQRQNINTNATGIVVSAVYDYDGSAFDGTLTLNNTVFSYATAQKQGYTVDSVSGGAHGITAISTNDETWFIWDSLTITITDPGDQRINTNTNASGIVVTAVYDYDGSSFDGALTLNNTQFSYSTAQIQGYTVDSVSGGTHGITAISANDETWCIWDSLTITITDPSDQRIDINANASGIVVSAVYDYDGSTFDGTLTLNNTQFSYATAQKQVYTADSVSGGTHGITTISTNDETWCIWDSLTITITDPSDQRININTNASGIVVSAVYDYDGSPFDGTLTLNNTQFSYATTQKQGYIVDSVSGGIYGISAISANDETWCIWDSLTITITNPSDQRINVNANASGIVVGAVYDYDGSAFDGFLTLNNTQFSYATAQKQGYTVDSVSGGGHGITAISTNDETWCIWDSLTITITNPADQHVNINTNASGIVASAVYDYDGSAFDGTITLNNTQFSFATAQKQGYTVDSVSGGLHGITAISTNDETWCIWDQLVIVIGVDDATPVSGHQANFTLTVTYDYDSATCATYQMVIDRNGTWWHSFTDSNWSQFVDTNSDTVYLYNASFVSSESTYGITAFITNTVQVVWSLAPNELPVNDSSPVLVNGDDTDYLYARYRYYVITSSVSDPDGFNDISYVDLLLYSDDQGSQYWTIRYTLGTDSFSVELGNLFVVISPMSNAVGSINTLTITWYIKIEWNHPIAQNTDVQQFVSDGTDTASNFTETNWNIETRLDYSTAPSLSDNHGDINTADLIGTGSVTYYNSGHSPLSNETDVWVVHDLVGAWSGNLAAGSFSISSIGSSASVRLNTYTFKIVVEGDGSGGPDLYYATSLTDTFITDRIEIYESGVFDGRIDINSYCEVWWRARYNFSGAEIQSGLTLELNGSQTLVWDAGDSYWFWQETSVSPTSAGFYVISASESGYGLTVWFNTTSVQQVIWDALVITMTDPADQRIDVGANASGIVVSAVYAFDGTIFDGIFTLNNTNFQYSTPQKQGYTVVTATGDSYGIAAIETNDVTFCIWDRVLVVSIVANETYNDPGDDVTITVELQFEYDGSPVLAGTFAISTYGLNHVGAGLWETYSNNGVAVTYDYDDLTICDASQFDISEYNMDSNALTVYWDRLEFYSVSVDDDRINVGASSEIHWSVRLEYAGISITSGVTAEMSGGIGLIASGGFYTASVTESAVGSVSYSILTSSFGAISQFTQSASDAIVIWDQILVTSITATLISLDSGTATEIRVTLIYAFDSTPVTSGQVNLDDNGAVTPMSYNTAGYWSATVSKTTTGKYTFTVDSVSGDTHGITSLDTDNLNVEVEWVGAPGFVLDTMTLMIIGGGAGIGILGLAIVASRRRRGGTVADHTALEPSDFGVAEPVEVEVPVEPEVIEPEPEALPEEIEPTEPEVVEEPEIEPEPIDEAVEPEEAELPPVDEELTELEAEEVVIEPEVEPELEIDEPSEIPEIIEEPVSEPEVEPEVVDYDTIPEEFIEPEAPVDLSKLTKRELLELIPADIRETTSPKELKRLTKQELISLVESFKDIEE